MIGGFSMLSFDLFGLFRGTAEPDAVKEQDREASPKGSIFFFGMFPVL